MAQAMVPPLEQFAGQGRRSARPPAPGPSSPGQAPGPASRGDRTPQADLSERGSAYTSRMPGAIAALAAAAIVLHLVLRLAVASAPGLLGLPAYELPLLAALLFGGVPLVFELLGKLLRREFGSDLLAGISIITAVLLGEYLAGTLVVLMLSGG